MANTRATLLAILSALILFSCESKLLQVYRIDVQQGNSLNTEDVNKIQLGMNKEQVRFVLGTPLLVDSFHPERWDYIYFFIPGQGERQRRQLTVFFDRDEVIDIYKDNIVSEDSPLFKADKEKNKQKSAEDDKGADEEQEQIEQDIEEVQDMLEKNKEATL